MNKIVGKKADGVDFLALVLEPGNLQRLQDRQPILVRVEEFFPDGIPKKLELVLDFSATPLADFKKLSKESEVVFDERPLVAPKQPHCPECKSMVEQLGAWKNNSPLALIFCSVCGCIFGSVPAADLTK